jgi:hypothetical protein
MSDQRLESRLAQLSEHDRFVAEAQMARAEALVDAVAAAVALLGKFVKAIGAPVTRAAQSYTDERTRVWPHAQA